MKVFEGILSVLYPKRCPICEKLYAINEEARICDNCKENLIVISEPKCRKCGKPIATKEIEHCFDCKKQQHYYEKGWSLWVYDERVKQSIYRYKYYNKKSYASIYAKEILTYYSEELKRQAFDLIIPVPLHPKKERKRGYNQATLLAEVIAREIGYPVIDDVLLRTEYTKPQNALRNKDRHKNVASVFKVVEQEPIMNKNILLIDDIYTTGSTINNCAKALLKHGANKVFFMALAIGNGF